MNYYPDKSREVVSVLWRAATVGRVLPVQVQAVKVALAQELDGLCDELFAVARRLHDLGERLRPHVPTSHGKQCL